MKKQNTSNQRFLTAACSGLALLGLALLPLTAAAQQTAEPSGAVTSIDSQIVVRDADTGKLRAATPEEHQAMRSHAEKFKDRRIGTQRMLPKTHASGARGARLTDEMLTTAVAVRQPDGSLKQCHASAEAVAAGASSVCSSQKPELE